MFIILKQLELSIFDTDLRLAAATSLGLSADAVRSVRILRRSLDARQHKSLKFQYRLVVEVPDAYRLPAGLAAEPWLEPDLPRVREARLRSPQPIIIGAGPAGLFAALAFAEAGIPATVIERGRPALDRAGDVNAFWDRGELNPESNMYFGEGGAGTFSDGKLNTRSKDPWVSKIIEVFVAAGAPEEIRWEAKPHLGTDCLLKLLPRLRQKLLDAGTTFRFNTRFEGLRRAGDGTPEICLNGDWTPARPLVLAIGHSAFATYRLLAAAGLTLTPKGNAFGVRLEHPAAWITERFYSKDPRVREILGHAGYNLAVPVADGQGSVYSFCCCPGGEVVSCAAVAGQVSVNGMSFSQRAAPYTNAGLVTAVASAEIADSAAAMLQWREAIEQRCFQLGAGAFGIPGQRAADFLSSRVSASLPDNSSRRPVVAANLATLFPPAITARLQDGLRQMERKVPGWIREGLLLGVETTTSAPVRIVRTPHGDSVSFPGVLPVGEGSGYAGGIMTSALDGYRMVATWLESQAEKK